MMIDDFFSLVYRQDFVGINRFISGGFDINSVDEDGRTALMHAVIDLDLGIDVVNFLIDKEAKINCVDSRQQWSALRFAARDNNFPIVEILLKAGALVDGIDDFGNTPLWRAVMNYSDDTRAIIALIENGADSSRQNKSGVSPLNLAEAMGNRELYELLKGR